MSINGVVTIPSDAPVNPIPSAMPPFSVSDIRKRTHAIQEVMRGVMKEGTHYGTIPGTPKPSLWKAGAEVLCMTFRLAPMLESRVTKDDSDSEWNYSGTRRDGTIITGTCMGFFEVEAFCTIHGMNGEILSRCSARCNNREAKYRNMPLFDIRNTILKMAEKRAFVSSVLMATGASDIFTQDIEDFPELVERHVIAATTASQAENAAPLTPAEPTTSSKPETKAGSALTAKRIEWLNRVALESHIPQDTIQRCMEFLRGAERPVVTKFFDELARRKGEAFAVFLAAS